MNTEQLEQEIIEAVEKAKRNGLSITTYTFGVVEGKDGLYEANGSNAVCPLGAYLIGKKYNDDLAADARVSSSWLYGFWVGFDNTIILEEERDDPEFMEAYACGQRLRGKYIEAKDA